MQDLINAYTFLFANIHVAGWFTLIIVAMKISWRLSRFIDKMEDGLETLDTVATNHLPHIQSGIEKLGDQTKTLQETLLALLIGTAQKK